LTAQVQLDPADLDSLVQVLKDGGFDSVEFEPGKVRAPGVWVRIDTITLATLAGGVARTATTLHLIVGDKEWRLALGELLPLLDKLCDVLTPTGPVVPTAVPLTGSTTQLPALAVPFELFTIPTPEEIP